MIRGSQNDIQILTQTTRSWWNWPPNFFLRFATWASHEPFICMMKKVVLHNILSSQIDKYETCKYHRIGDRFHWIKVNDIDTLVVRLILIYYISSIPIYTVYEIPLAWIITSYVIGIFNYDGFVPGNSWLRIIKYLEQWTHKYKQWNIAGSMDS